MKDVESSGRVDAVLAVIDTDLVMVHFLGINGCGDIKKQM